MLLLCLLVFLVLLLVLYCFQNPITIQVILSWTFVLLRFLTQMGGYNISPNIISYNSAIYACSLSWPLAIDLLDALRGGRSSPNLISYSSILGPHLPWRMALQMGSVMEHNMVTCDMLVNATWFSTCNRRWIPMGLECGFFISSTAKKHQAKACEASGLAFRPMLHLLTAASAEGLSLMNCCSSLA